MSHRDWPGVPFAPFRLLPRPTDSWTQPPWRRCSPGWDFAASLAPQNVSIELVVRESL
ncbi:hypothetical protein V8C44DRAFT_331148, partial [Trichoderma aethiopicum]